jgi:hypothetical protein
VIAIVAALAAAELPQPPFEAFTQFIYWNQCVVYGAAAMAGGDRAPEEILEIQFRGCRDREGRVQAEFDAHQPGHTPEQMARFRTIIREQALRRIAERRQPSPPTSN